MWGSKLKAKISFRTRLHGLCAILLCPLFLLAALLSNEVFEITSFSKKERDGVSYIEKVFPILVDVTENRSTHSSASLNEIAAKFDTSMKSWYQSTYFRVALISGRSKLEKVRAGQQLILAIGDGSNLILDPDLDSYYIMDITINKLPNLLVQVAEVDEILSGVDEKSAAEAEDKLNLLLGQVKNSRDGITTAMNSAIRNNSSGMISHTMLGHYGQIDSYLNNYDSALRKAITDIDAGIYSSVNILEAKKLNSNVFRSVRGIYPLYTNILDALILERINSKKTSLAVSLVISAFAALVALYIAIMMSRSVSDNVNAISQRIKTMMDGDFTSPIPLQDQEDELGDIARSLTVFREHSEEKAEMAALIEEQRRLNSNRLEELAYIDDLTGLANRKMLNVAFEKHSDANQGITNSALIFFDLDGFKEVNDLLNHAAGDTVLQEVARRLQGFVKEGELAVRLGGDEFAIFLPVSGQREELLEYNGRILQALSEPFHVQDTLQFLSGSAGIAMLSLASKHDGHELVRRADVAMYRAKALGKNQTIIFDPAFDSEVLKRREIESELRNALKNNELELHFQPQFDVQSGNLVGVEGLARWNHPRLGIVPPSIFIPIAESGGLISQLGQKVMLQAVDAVRRWPNLRISINLSVAQLRHHQFMNDIMAMVHELGKDVGRIEFEVTETVLMEPNPILESRLTALRDFGFVLALDDFGTGFASLGYLSRFHFDRLKIDQSFVAGAQNNERGKALLESIARLGLSLGMEVCAEGVENYDGLKSATTAGCTQIQGFYFSPAVDGASIDNMIAENAGMKSDDYDRVKMELATLQSLPRVVNS